MFLKKSRLKYYDLDLYSETLDNGLMVNIVPNDKVNNVYVTFSTKYGSIHDEFIPIDSTKYYKVPMGVAHFLEHKVFEQEDGTDPFNFFSASGAYTNANTSNYKTTYLFSGPSNTNENINYLLDFVQSPYFTDENVEKEKGIIAQEIKMLHDRPIWKLYDTSLYNSFINHPIKYPIGGTLESIMDITKDDLYKCYNSFYHPSNMFITVTGNIEPNNILKTIKDNQSKKKFNKFKPIKIKKYDEPDEVRIKKEVLECDVELPKVSLNYKINVKDYDLYKVKRYLNVYLSLILGSTSILDEDLRNKELISEGIEYDVVNTDKHLLYMILFESERYDEVISILKDTIGIVRVTSKELERKKKSLKSGIIYRSDSIYAINSKIDGNIINYNKVILDDYKLIDDMNIDELNDILDNISFDNNNIVILKNE
jgi:predicted Zn-dependent peptidase